MAGRGARANRKERRQALPQNQKRSETGQYSEQTTRNVLKVVRYEPRSSGQVELWGTLQRSRFVVASGPAGTGKTCFAVDRAVDLFLAKEVDRIILARPAVEAGEKLGALPGGIREKLDPFLRPLLDELFYKLGGDFTAKATIDRWYASELLEIVPIGMMRGRTLRRAAVVVDEMQNATYAQWKMVVTRLGEGSHMFITGDPEQVDEGVKSGMDRVLAKYDEHEYPVVYLDRADVQRDSLVADMLAFL
jgi:phosphate starvation-inducible PhoH-like protein